jgi:hypothetical protein
VQVILVVKAQFQPAPLALTKERSTGSVSITTMAPPVAASPTLSTSNSKVDVPPRGHSIKKVLVRARAWSSEYW